MLQQIVIGFVFLMAVFYVGRLVYRSFRAKSACDTGCGKCSAVDFNKIEAQIKASEQKA
jgi:hypothetical protein